ncbi:hypothetical protein BC832DRAFT_428707 [Gaertneriomyces semiglobifer]|nr:hypothetical protein BC832DRAFT_428707 [Gaertneriomyces semiglobifer]
MYAENISLSTATALPPHPPAPEKPLPPPPRIRPTESQKQKQKRVQKRAGPALDGDAQWRISSDSQTNETISPLINVEREGLATSWNRKGVDADEDENAYRTTEPEHTSKVREKRIRRKKRRNRTASDAVESFACTADDGRSLEQEDAVGDSIIPLPPPGDVSPLSSRSPDGIPNPTNTVIDAVLKRTDKLTRDIANDAFNFHSEVALRSPRARRTEHNNDIRATFPIDRSKGKKGSQSSLRSSTSHLSDSNAYKKRPPDVVTIKSPLSNEQVTIPIQELYNDVGFPSTNMCLEPVASRPVTTMAKVGVVYVEDEHRYRPWDRSPQELINSDYTGRRNVEERRWRDVRDRMMVMFSQALHNASAQFFHLLHGIFAGVCLLSVLLLPSFSDIAPPSNSAGDSIVMKNPVHIFLSIYIPKAFGLSIVNNILVTTAVLDTLDCLVGLDGSLQRWKTVWNPRVNGWSKTLLTIGVGCSISIVWITTILLTPLDDRLAQSHIGEGLGLYGESDW